MTSGECGGPEVPHHLTARAVVIGRVGRDDALLATVGLQMLGLSRELGSAGRVGRPTQRASSGLRLASELIRGSWASASSSRYPVTT